MIEDVDRIWQAVEAGDPRFDGWVFVGVTSTGIYCRPSCPARTPKRENVRFLPTAAAAQGAGFRACKRCRPDATPGSPEWDLRADLTGRAMRLIADGVVDREGVSGLAGRLGYSERHVHRQLVSVVGAGPLALARAQRAQTARILLETTSLPMTDIAFAAGFQSVRQFNATVQEIFATSPTGLRTRVRRGGSNARTAATRRRGLDGRTAVASVSQQRDSDESAATRSEFRQRGWDDDGPANSPSAGHEVTLRLPYRAPLEAERLIAFLGMRAVPGVEEVVDGAYRRALRLPRGAGTVELTPADGHIHARYRLDDLRDLATAVQRSRALLDLDSDPHAVVEALGGDPLLGSLVRSAPGLRVPGHVDAHELALRAVLGQQVSVAGAATLAGRLVVARGEKLERPLGGVTHLFPSVEALADLDPADLAMPVSRRNALLGLAAALASGELVLDAGVEREDARERLEALPGIGPWTAAYVAMRALRDPDAFLPTDLGVRHALEQLGEDGRPASATRLAEPWRPYRAYAVQHLWASLAAARGPGAKPASDPAALAA